MGQVGADRLPENLSSLKAADICPIGVYFYISDVRNTAIEARLKAILDKQDQLFGLGLISPLNIGICTHGSYMLVDVMNGPNNSYVYRYDFSIYSRNGSTKTINGNANIRLATVYGRGGFGYAPTLTRVEEAVTDAAEEVFQDFVLDWRKTH